MSSINGAVKHRLWQSFCLSAIAFGVLLMAVAVISIERQGSGGYVNPALIFFQVVAILFTVIFFIVSISGLFKYLNYTWSEDLAGKHTVQDKSKTQDCDQGGASAQPESGADSAAAQK